MSYTDSPTVALVATDCAICGLPLLDAVSVETAVGPTCRKKNGWTKKNGWGIPADSDWDRATMLLDAAGLIDLLVAGDSRMTCNRVVYRLACGLDSNRNYACAIAALAALGYRRLADACAPDLFTVRVETDGNELVVTNEFHEAFNAACRKVPGARWVKERKARLVPVASKAALWSAIVEAYGHGALVFGEKVAVT